MARITVEDCILRIPNRFVLVVSAAERARQIVAGSPMTVERDNDKLPVIALREIAEQTVDPEALYNAVIKGMRHQTETEEAEEEVIDLMYEEIQALGTTQAMQEEAIEQAMNIEDAELAEEEATEGEG